VRPNFFRYKKTLFDPCNIANASLARVLWCIGERGFVLGLKSGMAIKEERDRGETEVGEKKKMQRLLF
jgi:hypothetical protein